MRHGCLCNLARLQNAHLKKPLTDGNGGIHSTPLLVLQSVVGAGCPRRWCHISSCCIALDGLLFHVVLRGSLFVVRGDDGTGLSLLVACLSQIVGLVVAVDVLVRVGVACICWMV